MRTCPRLDPRPHRSHSPFPSYLLPPMYLLQGPCHVAPRDFLASGISQPFRRACDRSIPSWGSCSSRGLEPESIAPLVPGPPTPSGMAAVVNPTRVARRREQHDDGGTPRVLRGACRLRIPVG